MRAERLYDPRDVADGSSWPSCSPPFRCRRCFCPREAWPLWPLRPLPLPRHRRPRRRHPNLTTASSCAYRRFLGALSYLTSICDTTPKDPFRAQMQALIDAEANASPRREEFAGAYNRGYRGLASTYARCTDNARALIRRFRDEGVSITRQVRNLYGGG